MLKKLSIFMLIIFVSFVVVACSTSNNESNNGTSNNDKQKTEKSENIEIKVAHEIPSEGHPKYNWVEDFKKIIEEKTQEQVKVNIYPNNQLYSSEEATFQGLIHGEIQMCMPASAHLAGTVPEFQIFDLPMFFPAHKDVFAFQKSEIGQEMLGLIENKQKAKGIAYINNAPLHLYAKSPVTKLEEIKNLKIRHHGSPTLEASVKALGGNPIAMPSSELYLALQQGVVDGCFTTPGSGYTAKYYEVAPYLTKIGISYLVYPVIVNAEWWNELPGDIQDKIRSAASEATKINIEELEETVALAYEGMQEEGAEIIELSKSEREKWVNKLKPVSEEMSKEIDEELYNETKEFIQQRN